jgi:hypothetical protein
MRLEVVGADIGVVALFDVVCHAHNVERWSSKTSMGAVP